MEESDFTAEFEFKASSRMLFPYLNTPGGLSQWFADDVIVTQDKHLIFFWDEEKHEARIASQKQNKFIRFEFVEEESNGKSTETTTGNAHPYFIEINLDPNELTGTVFMCIVDTVTPSDDTEELYEIWGHLTDSLKEIVGG